PLSPPSSLDVRTIRSTRTNANNDGYGIHIAYSAQMVPVVQALIEDVLMTTAVREELEEGMREGMKETIKEQKEAVKREAERWDVVRKSMETRVKLKSQILEVREQLQYPSYTNFSPTFRIVRNVNITNLSSYLWKILSKFSYRSMRHDLHH